MSKLITPINKEDHVIGFKQATVELVEYGDFECPHCGAAYSVVKQLLSRFSKQLLFSYRHFPLIEVHPHAFRAAEAAEAAGSQGKFWEMHDLLFENQGRLDDIALLEYAAILNLDLEDFSNGLKEGRYKPKVGGDLMSGVKSGVKGTPTFFINNIKYDGLYDFDALARAIAEAGEIKFS